MTSDFNDPIVAISSPRGRGAIAIIRVSGHAILELAQEFIQSSIPLNLIKPRVATMAKFVHHQRLIDEVVLTFYKGPKSYTGEDVLEISCHGNDFIATQILEALLEKMRMANPGEFTMRAFLNHKMDLTRAEAVGNLLMAQTAQAQKASLMQLEGKLEKKIASLIQKITHLRIQCELSIDFIEDEVPFVNEEMLLQQIRAIIDEMQLMEKYAHDGQIIQEGLKICLIGAPNVGKSSIFNKFLEFDRAIVTDIPGTTRDYIEESIALNGNLIRIFDTAGIRQANDPVEKIGIDSTFKIIDQADLILWIIDAHQLIEKNINYDDELAIRNLFDQLITDSGLQTEDQRILRLINKSDTLKLEKAPDFKNILLCSAMQNEGLKPLKDFLISYCSNFDQEIESGLITNSRQLNALKKSLSALKNALLALEQQLGVEFYAFDLKSASEALEEIIGKISSDDLLDQIFDQFCIGK